MAHRLFASTVAGLCGALVLLAPAPAYADSVRDQQWSLDLLGAEAAWEHSRGDGVTVAVLDSGADADHPDLDGQVLAGRDVVSETDDASDVHGHGTAVAAIIAGHDDDSGVVGLAPEASILPVRVGGERMSETDVAEGIRWAVDHGADVINMSLGSPYGQESVADAVAYAIAKDVVVVAAAGNISEPDDRTRSAIRRGCPAWWR